MARLWGTILSEYFLRGSFISAPFLSSQLSSGLKQLFELAASLPDHVHDMFYKELIVIILFFMCVYFL